MSSRPTGRRKTKKGVNDVEVGAYRARQKPPSDKERLEAGTYGLAESLLQRRIRLDYG